MLGTGVDDFVDGAIGLWQDSSGLHAQSSLFPQLLGIRIERVLYIFYFSFDTQHVAPKSFVMMNGTFHPRRPMQNDHLKRLHEQNIPGIVSGIRIEVRHQSRQVQ